jgi:hypothetical protein
MDGFVACAAPMEVVSFEILQKTASVLLKLKSAHHAMKYHTDFSLDKCVTDEFPTPQSVTATTMYDYFKKQLGEKTVRISSLEDLETDLSKDRHFLKFRNAVTVKTNLAYAMVRLANLQQN